MPTSYNPEYDGASERFLLIKLENERSSDYAHITAYVVRAAVPSRKNPDNEREEYNDGPGAIGFRHCSFSSNKKNALYVEDLNIHSQINKRNLDGGEGDYKPYGIALRFKPYSVELREAKHFYNTLTKLDAKLEKLNHEFGYGENDLATFITRVASCLGIKKFLTYPKDTRNWSLDSGDLRVWKAVDVNFVVRDFIEQLKPQTA